MSPSWPLAPTRIVVTTSAASFAESAGIPAAVSGAGSGLGELAGIVFADTLPPALVVVPVGRVLVPSSSIMYVFPAASR